MILIILLFHKLIKTYIHCLIRRLRQICSNCGSKQSFIEAMIVGLIKINAPNSQGVGIHSVSNALGTKCPSCGEKSRWREEE